MMTETLTLRRVRPEDCEALFHWRNDPFVRQYSIDSSIIDWETHQAWFARALDNPDRVLLIGESDGQPVGVLRYDMQQRTAVVSIYLVPGCGGKGYGSMLLKSGSAWMKNHYSSLQEIEAVILPENIASRKAFERAGYQLSTSDSTTLTYHFTLTGNPK